MDAEQARVRRGIGPAILAFVEAREEWFAAELYAYVEAETGKRAPASADRILRLLKAEGRINYAVDRARSYYRRIPVFAAPEPEPVPPPPARPAVQRSLFEARA